MILNTFIDNNIRNWIQGSFDRQSNQIFCQSKHFLSQRCQDSFFPLLSHRHHLHLANLLGRGSPILHSQTSQIWSEVGWINWCYKGNRTNMSTRYLPNSGSCSRSLAILRFSLPRSLPHKHFGCRQQASMRMRITCFAVEHDVWYVFHLGR